MFGNAFRVACGAALSSVLFGLSACSSDAGSVDPDGDLGADVVENDAVSETSSETTSSGPCSVGQVQCNGVCVGINAGSGPCFDCGQKCPEGKTCRNNGRCGDMGRVEKVLELTNEARSKQQDCGDEGTFESAPPLELSETLREAAAIHAEDMAQNEFMSHTGSDGSGPGERIRRVGYNFAAFGENVAWGAPTPEAVVELWINSPGHCSNMMDPRYTEMGIGFRKDEADSGKYQFWVQVFARPR